MGVREHAVAIVGGGPAGMMLAAEMALAGVDVAVVERRPDHILAGSRAGGFQSSRVEFRDARTAQSETTDASPVMLVNKRKQGSGW